MRIPPAVPISALAVVLVLTGLWVGQHVNLLPVDASSNAPIYDELFRVLFSIGTMLFLGILGLLSYSLIRFRRADGDTSDGIALEGNLPLEILWTAIPAVVVLFVGIYSYDIYERMGGMAPLNDHGMHAMAMHADMGADMVADGGAGGVGGLAIATPPDAASAPRVWGGISPMAGDGTALPVEVTAMQFAFIFRYPETGIVSGELHVPAGRPIALTMTANDVIHAFWVPQFRIKQDVIPGQPTLLSFTATRTGSYPIVCAELCGPYHGGMRSTVVVQDTDSFEAWVAQNNPNPAPTTATAA